VDLLIYLNKFESPKGLMLAMCDEELMGNVFREGKTEIDLSRYGGFYKGRLVSEDDARRVVGMRVYSANVVGERSVRLLIEAGLVKAEEVKSVQGVPVVHLFRVER
jgi:hypothetical protein